MACNNSTRLKYCFFSLITFIILPSYVQAKTVIDQLQRRVNIPDNPARVVSLAPSITEIVFVLNKGYLLKGVTRFSDYPQKAAIIPKIGSYVNLDLEKIVALKPDLCIAVKDGNPIEIVKRLESFGIPVYAVNPNNLDMVVKTVLEIGNLLNAGETAKKIAGKMSGRIEKIKIKVRKVKHRPSVFFQIGISPVVSVGAGTFCDEVITLAGGRNVVKTSAAYPRFSKEQVLALNPEVIIICSMSRQGGFERMKEEWSRWPGLRAAKNRKIFLVDSNLFNRPAPRLLDGLELLFRLIHPEAARGK